MNRTFVILIAIVAAGSAPASAQSLFSSTGLGLPTDAVDGRARALASFGVGLPGGSLSPTDPAAAARLLVPTGVLVVQPSWVQASSGGERNWFGGTSFPLLGAAYPMLNGMVTLHFSSVLDQEFNGTRLSSVDIDGETVGTVDTFEQDGSVSQLTVGYARMLGSATSVGLSLGRYTGSLERVFVRTFDAATAVGAIESYLLSGSWSYSGYVFSGGVASEVSEYLNVAASAAWSSGLEADARDGTEGASGSFDFPLQLRVGATATVAPGLSVSASAVRADWSGVQQELNESANARSTLGFGVGIELSQARLFGRQAPLRLGYRRSGLPFAPGAEDAVENVFAGGFALVLAEVDDDVLASADLAVERGTRSGDPLEETFWRGTLSVRVTGF